MATGDKLVRVEGLKAVCDILAGDIADVKNAVQRTAGGSIVNFTDNAYIKNASTSDYSGNQVANDDWQCAVVPCAAGDTFGLRHMKGGSSGRLYAFFNSSNEVIGSAALPTLDISEYTEITAPENAAFVVFNNKKTEYSDAFVIRGKFIWQDVQVALQDLSTDNQIVSDRVGVLESALSAAGMNNNIVEPVFVNGSIALSSQALVYSTATTTCVTAEGKPFFVDPGTVIHLVDPATYKYKGWYAGNNGKWYVVSSSYGTADITVPGDKHRMYVLQVARNDGGAITPEELAGKFQLILPNRYPEAGEGLYKTFALADHLDGLAGSLPESGSGVASAGANYALTHFIPVQPGMQITYSLASYMNSGATNFVMCFYTSQLEYIANSGVVSGAGTVTVPENGCYVRVSVNANSTGNYLYFSNYGIPDQIDRQLEPIQNTLIRDVTGTDYMRAAAARIKAQLKAKSKLGNIVTFGFSTDQHIKDEDDETKTLPVLRGLQVLSGLTREYPFDFVCLGGDACDSGNYATTLDLILDECITVQQPLHDAWCPVVPLTGNHDAAQNNADVTGEMLFNAHFKRIANSGFLAGWDSQHTNGYWDSSAHQIRFIFFDDTIRNDYNQTARDSALSTMLSGTPEGYNIVVLSHHPLSQDLTDAKWQNPCACQNILADYASRIICCVCGHSHADVSEVSDGILYIGVTMAQYGTDLGGNTATMDSETETAFDTFVIDQTARHIYAFRYGKGSDRDWTYTLS